MISTMAYKSNESVELYRVLASRGYSLRFCELISRELNTSWTANRMLGYLRQLPQLREEDVVDEMLGILADRERIKQKNIALFYQGKLNELYAYGLDVDEEDDYDC